MRRNDFIRTRGIAVLLLSLALPAVGVLGCASTAPAAIQGDSAEVKAVSAQAEGGADDVEGESVRVVPSMEMKKAILAQVCEGGFEQISSEGLEGEEADVACSTCPSFTEGADGPNFIIQHITPGSFSGPGQSEVLAEYTGCDSAAGGYGGRVLLREVGDSMEVVDIQPGGLFQECKRFAREDGRDELVCMSSAMRQGYSMDALDLYSFEGLTPSGEQKAQSKRLAEVERNDGACLIEDIVADTIQAWSIEQGEAGKIELVVTIEQQRVPEIPDAYETSCDVPEDELEWQTEVVETRVEL
ncbi:hypothetical protein [Bradymonas sediminis]|uniref:Uncharacterized protein n=1 Tax=Bradymonas sediminis TaxID=1548548 RepID=A0A2Z4FMN5_9DELT|nr:hypothetical protein [Bradymonas sediminis]AWV90085.1 hypothetical protein DN745_12360 [Bradymonas sediminis]TDP75948.1 hypothetical protein DFR33_103297 [Bradymonas sediminis]